MPRRPLTELIARPDARAALQEWLDRWGTLHEAAALHPDADTLRGRGRVYVVPRPGSPAGLGPEAADEVEERWVVRHYQRGGAVASLLGDRYLRVGTPRPVREYEAGLALAAAGVPTPAVVGAAVYRSGAFYRGDLVTRWVPGSRDLAAVLFGGAEGAEDGIFHAETAGNAEDGVSHAETAEGAETDSSHPEAAETDTSHVEEVMRVVGGVVRGAHEAGLVHPDLNLKNILIVGGAGGGAGAEGVEAMVLDLDRARVLEGAVEERGRRGMIERFWRSARKWEGLMGRALPAGARAAFQAGYEAGYRAGSGDAGR